VRCYAGSVFARLLTIIFLTTLRARLIIIPTYTESRFPNVRRGISQDLISISQATLSIVHSRNSDDAEIGLGNY